MSRVGKCPSFTLDDTSRLEGTGLPGDQPGTGRTGQCIATRPRPPHLLAPCLGLRVAAARSPAMEKNAARRLQSRGPFTARCWSRSDQKWPIVDRAEGRNDLRNAHRALPDTPKRTSGPVMAHFWAKSGQIVSWAADGPFGWPERAHLWAADGPKMAEITREPCGRPKSGQKLARFGPHLASRVGGARVTRVVHVDWVT